MTDGAPQQRNYAIYWENHKPCKQRADIISPRRLSSKRVELLDIVGISFARYA